MLKCLIIIAAAVGASGCVGPLIVDHVKIDSEASQAAAGVKLYTQEELRGRSHALVQPLSAVSCMNKTHDRPASKDDAVIALKIKASRVLANGITNLYCEDPRGVNLANNCWSSIACHAAAIKVDP